MHNRPWNRSPGTSISVVNDVEAITSPLCVKVQVSCKGIRGDIRKGSATASKDGIPTSECVTGSGETVRR